MTAGAHNAIDLIARVVFDPGDEVWFEDPGYVAARATLVMNGAKVRPVPVDEEGLRVEDGLQLSPQARAAFVTPSHQYPLGVEMTKARRIQLLDWAEADQAWIVENDFGSDFRYAGSPAPTLYRIGRENGDRVIYVGTFSNVLAPGLRLGFLVAPNELIEPIRRVRIFSDRQPPEPLQSQLAEFIAQGFLADHLRRMNSIYQDRRDAVFEALQDRNSCSLDTGHKPYMGMHLVARLPRHDDALVSRKALEVGINVPALSGSLRHLKMDCEDLSSALPARLRCLRSEQRQRLEVSLTEPTPLLWFSDNFLLLGVGRDCAATAATGPARTSYECPQLSLFVSGAPPPPSTMAPDR